MDNTEKRYLILIKPRMLSNRAIAYASLYDRHAEDGPGLCISADLDYILEAIRTKDLYESCRGNTEIRGEL